MIEILSTKLYIPRPRPNLVSRRRLTQRLTDGLDRKLTLIAAPAGFGKTSLLSEWIPQSPRCVTWLSLDDADNDPTRFWTYVIASIGKIHPDLGQGALALLESSQTPPITSVITALINDVSAFPDAFSIVLDDYHLIDNQPTHQAMIYLIDHLPANLHVTLSTRADPPFPLARLRARNHMTEVRARSLRFTTEEAAAFLDRATGGSLSQEDVAALETRTEGWIAGLQIAALSMQAQHDIPGFIRSFSGSHRHILGYLAEEVINQRPEGTLDFLLQTSILDRLCGSLCDAVAGGSAGQATLEKLERANLFITPLDDEGRWYRYHQLFADVLRSRVRRTWPDRVAELHRRAARWHAQQGTIQEAVGHALAGGDHAQAATLIEGVAGDMLRRGASSSLTAWLDSLPDETIRARPQLCLARAWTYQLGSRISLSSALEWSELALQIAQADGSINAALAGEAAALQAMVAATRSEVTRTRELSHRALDGLPPESPWRSAVAFTLGTTHLETSDVAEAARTFEEALRLSQTHRVHYIQLATASFLGDILVQQGQLGRAMEMYHQVLAWAGPGVPHKGAAMAHAGLAHILCEQNQLDAALEHVRLGTDMLEHVGGAWAAFVLHRVVARVYQIRGHWPDALDTLDRAHQAGRTTQVSLVVKQAAALRAALELAQSNLRAAETWAAETRLSPEDPELAQPGWRELEYLTLARIRSAQGDHAQAWMLLKRLLEAADVQGRNGSAIAILIQQALDLQAEGHDDSALEHLERAAALAEPEGYLRIFVDEGEPMRQLLAELQRRVNRDAGKAQSSGTRRLLAYVDRLLATFSQPDTAAVRGPQGLPEPLTGREQEILRLMSEGLSNQEIAASLVVATSTVKSHINHLYGKLGAQRRTQAVSVARELGLLAE